MMQTGRGGLPKYARIAADLRARILAGDPGPGGQLESEPQLTGRYRVSKTTITRAMELLAAEGLITRRAGSGTFVAAVPAVAVVEVGPGTRITASGAAEILIERPGAASAERHRADVTVILVSAIPGQRGTAGGRRRRRDTG